MKGNGGKGRDGGSIKPTPPRSAGKGRKGTAGALSNAAQKKKGQRSPRITIETYNKMQDAFFKTQSVAEAARAAGVARHTAAFYIEGEGRPDVGMAPIKQTWLDVQVEAQERKQLTLLKFQEQQARALEDIVETALGELKLVRAEVVRRLKRFKESGGSDLETGASLGGALKSYERAVKLMERMLGAPDMTVAASGGEERYKNWSDTEILDYMATGKIPDHAR